MEGEDAAVGLYKQCVRIGEGNVNTSASGEVCAKFVARNSMKKGDYEEAITDYKRCLKFNITDIESYKQIAVAY